MKKFALIIFLIAFINIGNAVDIISWSALNADTIMALHLQHTDEEMEKGFKAIKPFPINTVNWNNFNVVEFLEKGGNGRATEQVQSVDILNDVLINILEQLRLIPTEDKRSRADIQLRHIFKHLMQNTPDLYLKDLGNVFKNNLGYGKIHYKRKNFLSDIIQPDFDDIAPGSFFQKIDENNIPDNYKYLPAM